MKINLVIVALLLIGLLTSCVVQETNPVVSDVEPVVTLKDIEGLEQESYLIQPGDQLEIKFYYNSELNASVEVRPDGKIALQLVDEIQVNGLTLTQLDDKLTESYGYELLRPDISVNLINFQGLRIYVGGEVNKQGFIEFRNNMTPLQAVLNAGGFKEEADPRSTFIIRKDNDNRPISTVVDLAKLLAGKNNGSDYLLLPDDIVYVPKLP